MIPGSGRYPGEGNGHPLQYTCLENPMDRGAWRATQSMGSQKIQTQLGTRAGMYPQRIPFGCYIFAFCLHFCLIVSIMKSTIMCQSPRVRDSALPVISQGIPTVLILISPSSSMTKGFHSQHKTFHTLEIAEIHFNSPSLRNLGNFFSL